jgi:hypothetical protein
MEFSGRQNGEVATTWGFHGSCLLLREGHGQTRFRPVSSERQAVQNEEQKAVICRNCGQVITSVASVSSPEGSRTHTFFNPAGIVYEIICFSTAPGCLVQGPSSTEFCWFAGFTWRLAFCGNCLTHLGWFYESRDSSFFGLILKKLAGDI